MALRVSADYKVLEENKGKQVPSAPKDSAGPKGKRDRQVLWGHKALVVCKERQASGALWESRAPAAPSARPAPRVRWAHEDPRVPRGIKAIPA